MLIIWKKGVDKSNIKNVMRQAIIVSADVYNTFGKKLVITSCCEGNHNASSLHPFGYALDLRTFYFKNKQTKLAVTDLIRKKLGSSFYVVLEKDHIHIQYNKKLIKGF